MAISETVPDPDSLEAKISKLMYEISKKPAIEPTDFTEKALLIMVTNIIKSKPKSIWTANEYFCMAFNSFISGEYEHAIEYYTDGLKLDPYYIDGYYYRGSARSIKSEYITAIEDYNKVLELRPNDIYALNGRGIAKGNIGDYSGAVNDFEIAIQIKPDVSEIYTNRANQKSKLGDYNGAIDDYKIALKCNPSSYIIPIIYYNIGYAEYGKGNLLGALENYIIAIDLKSDYADAHFNIGFVYFKLGIYRNALPEFDNAIKYYGENRKGSSVAYYYRYLTNKELGNYIDAKRDIDKSKELGYEE